AITAPKYPDQLSAVQNTFSTACTVVTMSEVTNISSVLPSTNFWTHLLASHLGLGGSSAATSPAVASVLRRARNTSVARRKTQRPTAVATKPAAVSGKPSEAAEPINATTPRNNTSS